MISNSKTTTAITALVLIPLVALSAWAYIDGQITYGQYVDQWAGPAGVVLGFWFRGQMVEG